MKSSSLCPRCFSVIDATVFERAGRVYIEKTCPDHGTTVASHPWSDPLHYRILSGLSNGSRSLPEGLVINLTSRCNRHCPFCFALADEQSSQEPSIAEITQKAASFRGSIIYLSGGEPTLRDDLFAIIRRLKALRRFKVFLFTNGKKLSDAAYVGALGRTKVDLVILQFDTLDEARSRALRGEPCVHAKLEAIRLLGAARIPVYLFAMLVKGVNSGEVGRLIAFAAANPQVRILNFNPVWEMGRFGAHPEFTASSIVEEIEKTGGITAEDFIASTRFSYYLFSALQLLSGRGRSRQPKCEMRCYMALHRGAPFPLAGIVDLPPLTEYLRRFCLAMDGRRYGKALAQLALAVLFLMKECCRTPLMRRLASNPRIFSIIVGTFHTGANVDLDFTASCNLFSDYPGADGRFGPACIRQMEVTAAATGR